VDVNRDGDRNDILPDGTPEYMINMYPYGFSPMQESDETDFSLTVGMSGENSGWSWDLASVYGSNKMDYYTIESMNFTIWNETGASPTDFLTVPTLPNSGPPVWMPAKTLKSAWLAR